MALLNQPTQVYSKLPQFLETLRSGTAPSGFNRQFLKDIGFKSSNDHAFIPLLKGLGFLSSEGVPTDRYRQFLDGSRWRKVLAEAVRESYGDIFVLKAKPTASDLAIITGKYKSTYNLSDVSADRAARTFLALLALCDQEALYGTSSSSSTPAKTEQSPDGNDIESDKDNGEIKFTGNKKPSVGLHYNIQIHLPATKDVEIYNSIFKSLRDHLID